MLYFAPVTATLLLAVLATAVVADLRWRRLPNWLTFGGACAGLALNVLVYGTLGAINSTAGWSTGCALLSVPFLLRGVGAGDVKLLAAVGALKGASFVLVTFIYGALVGGALAIALLLYRGEAREFCSRLYAGLVYTVSSLFGYGTPLALVGSRATGVADGSSVGPVATAGRQARLPYGVAIAVGSLIALALGL